MSKLWIFEAFTSIFQKSFSFKTKIQPLKTLGAHGAVHPGSRRGADSGPLRVSRPQLPATYCRGGGADRRELTIDEVAGDEVTTHVTTGPRRTYRCIYRG